MLNVFTYEALTFSVTHCHALVTPAMAFNNYIIVSVARQPAFKSRTPPVVKVADVLP